MKQMVVLVAAVLVALPAFGEGRDEPALEEKLSIEVEGELFVSNGSWECHCNCYRDYPNKSPRAKAEIPGKCSTDVEHSKCQYKHVLTRDILDGILADCSSVFVID